MTDTEPKSVLQRKLASGGGAASGRSILRALRVATARAAADAFDLALSVIAATQAWRGQDDLAQHLDETRLLMLLDGPDNATGALALDRAALAALIQQQTMGKVLGGTTGTRPYTATDAALAAPLVDAMLAGAQESCDAPEDRDCLAGFRFGAQANDSRSLLLALDADRFRVFDLTLDIDGGLAQGAITLILPEPSQMDDAADADMDEPDLGAVLGTARAELTVSIGHLRLPFRDLAKMKVGDMLPLDERNLRAVDLWSIGGKRVAGGRLGQVRGFRAIRLDDGAASDPDAGAFAARALALASVRPDAARAADTDAPLHKASKAAPQAEEDQGDAIPGNLTPAQVAEEISQLAGLSPEDGATPEAEE